MVVDRANSSKGNLSNFEEIMEKLKSYLPKPQTHYEPPTSEWTVSDLRTFIYFFGKNFGEI